MMAKLPLALQLYTVRDQAAQDFTGTLEKVAGIGYDGVEIAGVTGGLSASDLKKLLDDLGLKVAGNHTGIDQLEGDLNSVVDFNKTIGNHYVVVPYLGDDRRQGAEGWSRTAATMNRLGSQLKEAGLQLCYHNHSFEFQKFDGQTGMEIFYGASDPNLVQAEVDVYWVQHGGEDPVAFLRRYAGRTPLIHLKDMSNDEKRFFAEVGTGILDFTAIVQAAEEGGAEWLIVEQDVCPGDPMESARISFQNIKERGWA
jgi:sugar phosphate isomerase/epimerase